MELTETENDCKTADEMKKNSRICFENV